MQKNMRHTSRNSFRISTLFVVGNNDHWISIIFYEWLGGLPDIITCCRFSLHDASPLKDSLMDLSQPMLQVLSMIPTLTISKIRMAA